MFRVSAVLPIICWIWSSWSFSADAFPTIEPQRCRPASDYRPGSDGYCLSNTSKRSLSVENSRRLSSLSMQKQIMPSGESYSTLTLLEHMHLLTPNVHHSDTSDDDGNFIDLFVNTMGFGLDPKSVKSIDKDSGVVFVNCGASQLHLNDDSSYCQKMEKLQKDMQQTESDNNLPAYEIGLRYTNLSLLKENMSKAGNLCTYETIDEGSDRETIRVTDTYGRVFVARKSKNAEDANLDEPSISSICQQKVIHNNVEDTEQYGSGLVERYGVASQPICQGIDYIEFFVPVHKDDDGKTVEKIARFYDFFFDATTTVAFDGTSHIAIIGFGKIDENGRAEQSMLFRERLCDNPPKAGGVVNDNDVGTGHHIAIYVGSNDEDFEVAATNCMDGGILWVNTLFEDRVLDVDSAMKIKQFRFKDIIDIETGDVLYALEHEIRSVSHDLFPGTQ